jgi:hypothetical protein
VVVSGHVALTEAFGASVLLDGDWLVDVKPSAFDPRLPTAEDRP